MTESVEYDRIAREVFLPVFPMIAQKALDVYGRRDGICLDIGCGGGMFGYFVALLSGMKIQFLDLQQEAITLCRRRGGEWGLAGRCGYTVGDVHQLPFEDNRFSLIVSRGSIPFWGEGDAMKKALTEIYRVLQPGGTAMIGGSLGTPAMREAIIAKMKEHPEWHGPGPGPGFCRSDDYEVRDRMLTEAGIPHRMDCGDCGQWIFLNK